MSKKRSGLNPREQLFVDHFFGKARGNATKAAILSGYSQRSARNIAWRLMTKAHIQRAVVTRRDERTQSAILNAEERDKLLSEIAVREKIRDPKVAKSCIAELNKCDGRHSINVNHKGRLTIEDALESVQD